MMVERKTYTLKSMKEGLENCLLHVPVAKINLHNERSFSNDTIFSTVIMPLNKALKIFGDCEILYPQLSKYDEEYNIPCVKFGIVVED